MHVYSSLKLKLKREKKKKEIQRSSRCVEFNRFELEEREKANSWLDDWLNWQDADEFNILSKWYIHTHKICCRSGFSRFFFLFLFGKCVISFQRTHISIKETHRIRPMTVFSLLFFPFDKSHYAKTYPIILICVRVFVCVGVRAMVWEEGVECLHQHRHDDDDDDPLWWII